MAHNSYLMSVYLKMNRRIVKSMCVAHWLIVIWSEGWFGKGLLEEVGLEKMVGVDHGEHKGERHRQRTLW